jgi:hypothetical protein
MKVNLLKGAAYYKSIMAELEENIPLNLKEFVNNLEDSCRLMEVVPVSEV